MNKMKKIIIAIAVALSFVLPTWAAEVNTKVFKVPEGPGINAAYRGPFIYWAAVETESLCKGFSLAMGEEVPYATKQKIFELAYKHAGKNLLPALRKHEILPEWVFIMSHPDVRDAHYKIITAKTEKDFLRAVREATTLAHTKRKSLRKLGLDEAYFSSYCDFLESAAKLLDKG